MSVQADVNTLCYATELFVIAVVMIIASYVDD